MNSSARLRLLIHPAFCGAVALVAVNDHLLKARWPGVVTGKLSDVVGVFAATIAVAAATGAVRRAAVAVGFGFAALKLSTDVARLAAPLLGGRTRQDATDLLALVALWPAIRFVERALPTAGRHDRARRNDAASTALVVAAIAATVLTTTATSCERNDGVTGVVVADDGTISAKATEYTTSWYSSADGGASWSLTSSEPAGRASANEACVDQRCLRVTGTAVEQRDGDGPWTTSFTYTPAQMANLERRISDYHDGCRRQVHNLFGSVLSTESGGRRIDLVAMGTEGALRRVDGGAWTPVGIGSDRPISVAPPSRWPAFWRAAWLVGPAPLVVLGPLIARRRRRTLTAAVALAVAFGVTSLIGGAALFWTLRAPTPVVTVASLVAAYSFVVWFARRNPAPVVPPPWPPPWPPSPPRSPPP